MTLDYDERYIRGKPQNSFHKAVNIPDVIVYPRWDKLLTFCWHFISCELWNKFSALYGWSIMFYLKTEKNDII